MTASLLSLRANATNESHAIAAAPLAEAWSATRASALQAAENLTLGLGKATDCAIDASTQGCADALAALGRASVALRQSAQLLGPMPTTCASSPDAPDANWRAERPQVRMETSRGAMTLALEQEGAPLTTNNFLNLTRAGFYNGTQFHRVIGPTKQPPHGFVVQGGDPNTKDNDPTNDGLGGPKGPDGKEYAIPDEFNPTLRHAAAGTLSMANAGPDSGGSQFFITLDATSYLDDRHSVFGHLATGLDVLQALGAAATDSSDRPTTPLVVSGIQVVDPAPFAAAHAVGVHVVVPDKNATGGRGLAFALVLQNSGNVRDAPALDAAVPAGWACRVDAAATIAAGTARVVFLHLTPPAGAAGVVTVPLTARSAWNGTAVATGNVTIHLRDLGAQVRGNDQIVANYVGLLADGRLFDTSLASVAHDAAQPKLDSPGGWREHPGYSPVRFNVTGVIAGFAKLATGARVGETVTGPVPKEDAYMNANCPGKQSPADTYCFPLLQRDLVFELEIVAK